MYITILVLLLSLHSTSSGKTINNTEVLECANMKSVFAILSEIRLCWLGHCRRMDPGCISKDLLYGELPTPAFQRCLQKGHEAVEHQHQHLGKLSKKRSSLAPCCQTRRGKGRGAKAHNSRQKRRTRGGNNPSPLHLLAAGTAETAIH